MTGAAPASHDPGGGTIGIRSRRQWIPAAELIQRLAALGPDNSGWAAELRETLTEAADDLRW